MPRRVAAVARSPRHAIRVAVALFKGHVLRLTCRLRGIRLEAGPGLRIEGRLSIRGPGLVRMGRNVRVGDIVTPWTYSSEAVIEIGDGVFLNGTSFGAWQRITIGARCILARCNIMDSDFHSTRADRHDPAAPVRVRPVRLGENVWVAANAGILPGTRIGENSVVGFGAVCSGEYPKDVIIAGNPAEIIRPIPTIPD